MNSILRIIRFSAVLLAVLSPAVARADDAVDVPAAPILRIETGMDTGGIKRIGVDAAGAVLVTSSIDKTLRIWDARTGAALGVLRPPIGLENDGKLFGLAISPDGKTVASGGWTGYDWDGADCVYIFDRESGRMITRLTGLAEVIDDIQFSPDGKLLAVTTGGESGLKLYSTATWTEIGADPAYAAAAYGLSIWQNSTVTKIATASYDGYVRTYKVNMTAPKPLVFVAKHKMTTGALPYQCRFSPDGSQIAVGFSDQAAVCVLSASTLNKVLERTATGTGSGNLTVPAWSADGATLYAGGSYGSPEASSVLKWSQKGAGPQTEVTAVQNSITDIIARGNNGVFVGSGFPLIGAFDKDGQSVFVNAANVADYPIATKYFRIDQTGGALLFSFDQDLKFPAYLSVPDRTVRLDPGDAHKDMTDPVVKDTGIVVEHWRNSVAPTLAGKAIPLEEHETSRSLAILPDKSGFVLGTEWYVRAYSADGTLKWQHKAPEAAWAVNVSGDGRVAVATMGDGTIRWYRMSDGQEVLAAFPLGDKKRWVMWTPSGYYDCSIGGDDLLGWHVNRGKDQAADFFPASRFRDQFYRPDVIARVLTTLDEDKAVHDADAAAGREYVKPDVIDRLPPVVRILSPDSGTPTKTGQVTIKYLVRAGSTEKAESVHFQVNGRNQGRAVRVQLVSTNEQEETETIDVPSANCTVSVVAENRFGSSQAAAIDLRWQGDVTAPTTPGSKPKLYILAVGIEKYRTPSLTMPYAAKDAADFCAAMVKQKGSVYEDVVVKQITGDQATRGAVEDGLDWIHQQSTAKDVAMVFLSGRGAVDSLGKFVYAPYDFDSGHLKSSGVPASDIADTMAGLPGKAVLFLDTASVTSAPGAGRSDVTGLVNELSSAENGTVVFTASSGGGDVVVADDWTHSAFSQALIEGLGGDPKAAKGGKVTVESLGDFLASRVSTLTQGKQHPAMQKPATVPDFQIASAGGPA